MRCFRKRSVQGYNVPASLGTLWNHGGEDDPDRGAERRNSRRSGQASVSELDSAAGEERSGARQPQLLHASHSRRVPCADPDNRSAAPTLARSAVRQRVCDVRLACRRISTRYVAQRCACRFGRSKPVGGRAARSVLLKQLDRPACLGGS